MGLDFRRELVPQEQRPAAAERQLACRSAALLLPPVLEGADESGPLRYEARGAQPAVGLEPQGSGRFAQEHAHLAERPVGGTFQEQRVALGKPGGEAPQHRGRHRELADQRAFCGQTLATALQALKRRKISEPLVPPKPKEFDSATSIFMRRAVLGT